MKKPKLNEVQAKMITETEKADPCKMQVFCPDGLSFNWNEDRATLVILEDNEFDGSQFLTPIVKVKLSKRQLKWVVERATEYFAKSASGGEVGER